MRGGATLGEVVPIFVKVAAVSGLVLDFPKTVAAHLWADGLEEAYLWVLGRCRARDEVGKMVFGLAAKYLGVWLGPGASTVFWKGR